MKKKISFILVICILFMGLTFPMDTAHAASYYIYYYTLNNGEITITSCENPSSINKIEIPDRIYGYPVTAIGNNAFSDCINLTRINIPSSVTGIGYRAFSGCTSLRDIYYDGSYLMWNVIRGQSYLPYDRVTVHYAKENTGTCGEDLWWVLDENGILTITGTGDMNDYYKDAPWRSAINGVIIGNGVTSIGSFAFESCTGLTSIIIPDSVTSIGDNAFRDCTQLTNVTVPDSVTSIGDRAFRDCTELESITIPDSVASIGIAAFSGCTNLTDITIPKGVTAISDYAFYGCSGLKYITISSSVTSIGSYAFSECTYFIGITIPEGVTTIGDNAFSDCTDMQNITIPNSVTSIGNDAFSRCTSLTDIYYKGSAYEWVKAANNIPAYINVHCGEAGTIFAAGGSCGEDLWWVLDENGILTVTGTGDMNDYYNHSPWYAKRDLVKKVIIDFGITSIGDYAFYDCYDLESISIPYSVTSIGEYAFEYCSSLESITLPSSINSIGEYAFCDCDALTDITIPYGITNIRRGVFYGCESLMSITISSSVTSISSCAFENCRSLISITIPSSVRTIESSAFKNVTPLVVYYMGSQSNWNGISWGDFNDGVKNADVLFNQDPTAEAAVKSGMCGDNTDWAITNFGTLIVKGTGNIADYTDDIAPWNDFVFAINKVVIDNGVTDIGEYAFKNCTALRSVEISDTVTGIGAYAFSGCSGLKNLKIPDSVKSIGEYAFLDCSSLTVAELGTNALIDDNIGTVIRNGAFAHCGLTDLTIGSGVTSIGDYAFSNCSELKSLIIPNRVNSIGNYAFDGCIKLTDITIPKNVTSIGNSAFDSCFILTNIYYAGSREAWKKIVSSNGNGDLDNVKVHFADIHFGDVNGDGKVTPVDKVYLDRYLAQWEGYDESTIDLSTSDVNCDGIVNELDSEILEKHLAKCAGYEVLPYTGNNENFPVNAKITECSFDGNTLTGAIEFAACPVSCTAIIAAYENNRLLEMAAQAVSAGETQTTLQLNSENNLIGKEIKVFFLKSFGAMEPIGNVLKCAAE